MNKLGITGPIGSGKSTVVAILQRIGVPVYDSDSMAKKLMVGELSGQIEQILGVEAYDEQGQLNRKWVAERIFSNPQLKQAVERVVHPAVVRDFERWATWVEAHRGWVGVESAILVESGLVDSVDAVLLVDAPEALRIERTVRRDNTSPQAVRQRMTHQMLPDQWAKYATWTLLADGRPLEQEVVRLFEEKIITFAPRTIK